MPQLDSRLARCSFCQKEKRLVTYLVAGQEACICDGCIAASQILVGGSVRTGKSELPPGPRIPAIVQMILAGFWERAFLDYCARHYGDCFTTRMPWMPPFVHFRNPKAIETIFEADGEQVRAANHPLDLVLGEHSLLILQGESHERDRRLLSVALHGDRLRRFCKTIVDETDRVIDRWPMESVFPIHPEMRQITLAVMMRAILGVEHNREIEVLRERLNALLSSATGWMWMVPRVRSIGGKFSPLARIQRARCDVDEILDSMLARRRCNRAEPRDDALATLVDAADRSDVDISDAELRDEIVTLLVAGHETTATALAWAILRLHQHRDVLTAVRTELGDTLRDGEIAEGNVESLRYLDAAVKETLRWDPVISQISRVVSRPIHVSGYDLPIGVVLHPSIDLVHRNPDVWPEPERFMPERFLARRPGPYDFMPFGGGIRRCIGMSFALYEIKTILARILSRCDLHLAQGYQARRKRRAITMTPSRGVPVVIDARR